MNSRRIAALAPLAFALAGCATFGHVPSPGPSLPKPEYAPAPYNAPASVPYRAPAPADDASSGWSAPQPSAPATRSAPSGGYYGGGGSVEEAPPPPRAEAEAPRERPGLGTEWGEARYSPVHDVPFERAGATPFSIATVYYNDRDGVSAMASYELRRSAASPIPMLVRGGLLISVVDEYGSPLPAVTVGGRIYVTGEAGRRYNLIIRNNTGRRYEAVVSVDGLDVIDGRPASTDKRGYLVGPFGSVTIDGFRQSDREVAAFRFGAVHDSYAAKTSGDRNVGVIGWAFFDEQGAAPWTDEEIERRRTAQPFSDARYAQPPPF